MVQRLAAIAVDIRGDAAAGEYLAEERERNPTAEVIEALPGVWDDDSVVHLDDGQIDRLLRAVAEEASRWGFRVNV